MSNSQETAQRRRPMMLAAVMVAVLLVSLGAAAWLVQARGGKYSRGVEILEHIRREGLPSFWGDGEATSWYLLRRQDGVAVGWRMVQRAPAAGGYTGKKISRTGPRLHVEAWSVDVRGRLSSYRAEGSTVARSPRSGSRLIAKTDSTRIALRGGRVEVLRNEAGRERLGTGDAPANYIPEGLHTLVYFLATAGQQEASFTTVFNEQSVVGNRAHFSWLRVEPQGARRVRLVSGAGEHVYQFGGNGELLRLEMPEAGRHYERVPAESVQEAFPDASYFARRELGP
jgi:hypothetical protein